MVIQVFIKIFLINYIWGCFLFPVLKICVTVAFLHLSGVFPLTYTKYINFRSFNWNSFDAYLYSFSPGALQISFLFYAVQPCLLMLVLLLIASSWKVDVKTSLLSLSHFLVVNLHSPPSGTGYIFARTIFNYCFV